MATKRVADDIPRAAAWQHGHRVYIRIPRGSPMPAGLRAAGAEWTECAKWAPKEHCLWVGEDKLPLVLPVIRALSALVTRETAARAEARRNEYPAWCTACGHTVQAGAGRLQGEPGAWSAVHLGGCPAGDDVVPWVDRGVEKQCQHCYEEAHRVTYVEWYGWLCDDCVDQGQIIDSLMGGGLG